MSNPYAPPEDRPRTPPADPAGGDPAEQGDGTGAPDGGSAGPTPPPLRAAWPEQRAVPREPERGPAPDAEAAARVSRLAGTFGVLVLASLLVATRPMPWRLASAVFATLAVVWGVRALRTAMRAGFRGGLPAMLGIGVAVAAGWALLSLFPLLAWDATRSNQECVARALTVTANAECLQQFHRDVEQRNRDLRDGLGRR